MERTKKCPYCGEEILATAMKCRHCGEWFIESSNMASSQRPVRKESYFESKFLYDKIWMDVIFWVTIIGSFIQAVHKSGLTVSETTMSYFKFIRYAGKVPEVADDFLCAVGEICFITLLMKVFSNFHKPLKEWFLAYIFFGLFTFVFYFISDNLKNEAIFLFVVVDYIFIILLPIMIISHYEGKIKTLGYLMIGYSVVSVIVEFIAIYVVPIAAFFIFFLIDFFYYSYIRNTLTKY